MERRSVQDMVNSLVGEDGGLERSGLVMGNEKPKIPLRPGEVSINLDEVIHVKPIGMVIGSGPGEDGKRVYFRFFGEKDGMVALKALTMMNEIRMILEKDSGHCGAMLATPTEALLSEQHYNTLKALAG